ncbi:MAG TPA: amidase [Acidimicrobiales bacterium]|nr:amidase [Acidimicrobiales bacterium]
MGDILDEYDATGLSELVARGDVTAVELVEASIARIDALEPKLNAVIHRQFDRARRDATGELPTGPFTGVPLLFKDLGCEEAGEPHHQGMRVLRDVDLRSPTDSPLALRFRSLGFIPIGRTNTPELALMGTTEPDSYGPTHNPWDLGRSPGGSSGGSGAAVAAGYVPVAHANDIAGSIRIPAAQCGIVGLKPSRGRVLPNRPGDVAVTMLSEGAITRTIRDTAAVLDGLADSPATERLAGEVDRDPGRLRVGLCVHAFTGVDVDEACVAAAREAALLLEGLGHDVEEAWPPALYDPDLLPGATNLAAAHTAAVLDRWSTALGRALGESDVEPASWSLISRGRALSGADVMRAMQRQEELSREIRSWWHDFDLLLTPTTAEPGPPLGAYKAGFAPGRGSAFTRVFNATGQPALSLPLGWPADGMPRGVQLVAAYGRDDVLIRIGSQLEHAAPWAHRRPPLPST